MGDHGLRNSIWAPSNHRSPNSNFGQHAGGWECSSCSFSNFKWRTECLRCSAPKSGPLPAQIGNQTSTSSLNSHQKSKVRAEYPSVLPGAGHFGHLPEFKPAENGLATSRWAPKRQTRGEAVQVWTRTIPSTKPSRSASPSKVATKSVASPDLGLPYQVQHYILALIQRILEEGCYDFASRWLPQVLNEKGWDCSEAVELSTWKNFLPANLPTTAIKPLSNYTLEAALADAVRIRNSAVHRHLCDNNELRKMTLQAQDLMSMFSDTTRQNKLHQLWAELNVWNFTVDPSGARIRLERALQEISERPMDDMDWTPNAVSLEEVQSCVDSVESTPEHFADEMELD